ncbi:MAG: hypothetical protein B7Z35_06485 [Hydrogenophilales bacterium 12-61-10]|nr:MAG: hypothetical protein B7Z35_06485 [Hydrogenophilales bacterium 12-61-10]
MNTPKQLIASLAVLASLATGNGMADDGAADAEGKPVLKSLSHEGSAIPTSEVPEAEHAFIAMMKFYVPAQAASGATTLIDYFNADGTLVSSAGYAKPLIGAYIYGPVEGVEGVGFVGHGKREAYAAVSFDDGLTWKNTNLSESATETSCDSTSGSGGCTVDRDDVPLFASTTGAYPGDVINTFHAVAGNKALVAWPSRYCASGEPNYSLDTADPSPEQIARRAAIASYLGDRRPGAVQLSVDRARCACPGRRSKNAGSSRNQLHALVQGRAPDIGPA